MSRTVIRWGSLVFTGLFAGFLLGILVLELALRGSDGTVYTQTQQVALVGLPGLAGALLFPALICSTILLMTHRQDGQFALLLAAVALLGLALVVTLIVNVPINVAESAWSATAPPADWSATRDRWQAGHLVRTGASIAAFGLLVSALLRSVSTVGSRVRPRRNR